jgi:hypothetical protein
MSDEDISRSTWRGGIAAPAAALAALEATYPGLPVDYLQHVREDDGAEGELDAEPGWIALWPVAEVARLNAGYELSRWLPGFLGFGSNGGGELFVFDTRALPWRICMVPFIPMEESDAVEIAPDFASLASHFVRRSLER